LLCVAGLASAPGPAQESPDLELNPVTGYVESVDTASGSGNRVRHVIDQGPGQQRILTLVSSGAGLRPRITIDPDGNSWVIWGVDGSTDGVAYAKRANSTGAWSGEVAVSDPEDDSRSPEIVAHGGAIWLAYEIDDGSTVSIVVASVIDSPEPIPQITPLGSTSYSGNLDLMLHSEDGHLWLSWVDSSTEVGWSEFDAASETWGFEEFESYSGTTVEAARDEIRALVLGD
jgi:hypothetical protein